MHKNLSLKKANDKLFLEYTIRTTYKKPMYRMTELTLNSVMFYFYIIIEQHFDVCIKHATRNQVRRHIFPYF